MKFVKLGTFILTALVIVAQYACVSSSGLGEAAKLEAEKDYQGAIEVYQSVIAEKPGTAEARKAQLEIGKLYIRRMNRPEMGVKAYQDVIASDAASEEAAEARYQLGMHYFRSKDYKAAQEQFDVVVNEYPNLERSHDAQLMLAKSYEEAKDYEQAAEIYDNAANRNPQSKRAAQALANKAKIEKTYIGEAESRRTYQRLVKRFGNDQDAQEQINKAKEELELMGASIPKPDDPLASQVGRREARQQARRERDRPRGGVGRSPAMGGTTPEEDSGFGVKASEIMQQFSGMQGGAIQSDEQGTYYDAMLMIASFQFGDENYPNAGALYHRAIQLARADNVKIDPYSYLNLSVCYRKIGMHKRAKEVLKKAIKADKDVLQAVIDSAKNQYHHGAYEKALEIYNSVLGISKPKDHEIYWLIALCYKKMEDPQNELMALEHAVAAKVNYTDGLQSLAEVLAYRLKNRKRAEIFQKLVDGKETSYRGEKELADLCYKYGNYARAKSKYKAAARIAKRTQRDSENNAEKRVLDNKIAYAYIRAAVSAHRLNQEDEVKQLMDSVATEYPDSHLIPYGQGAIAMLKGDTKTAIAAFNESIEKNPHSDVAPIALGEYYLSVGNMEDAVALWEKFLEKNRHNQNVRQRLNKVKGKSGVSTDKAPQ